MSHRVLICDPIADDGVEALRASGAEVDVKTGLGPDELKSAVDAYDALVVRSETKVTREIIEAASNLQVVGRAGVGVDNIDLEAATERGVVVVNAPTGNTISLGTSRRRTIRFARVSGSVVDSSGWRSAVRRLGSSASGRLGPKWHDAPAGWTCA
jgi:hypothetical protein